WAWRERRAAKIGVSADRVLCLFPMEPGIYEKYGVEARFVGHPLADRFPLGNDREAARTELALPQDAPVLAPLPRSRPAEIQRRGAIFLEAAARMQVAMPELRIVIPAANARRRAELVALAARARFPGHAPMLIDGQSRLAMTAADVVLLASGTAALEAMLA